MENCEAMTSSSHSFAYSYRLVKKYFLKICETSKCHNFLIFQPIFIRFSLFCSKIVTLFFLKLSYSCSGFLFNFIIFQNFSVLEYACPVWHTFTDRGSNSQNWNLYKGEPFGSSWVETTQGTMKLLKCINFRHSIVAEIHFLKTLA